MLPNPNPFAAAASSKGDLAEKIGMRPSGSWSARRFSGSAVAARGEEPLDCRSEDPADELDPETIPMFVDEPDHLGQGRSSSFAKNTLAALRISFALRSSAFSFCSLLISAAASVVNPGFTPASTS